MLAGPGTGKTHALAHKIKHLIKKEGVNQNTITVITFTNEAAISMRNKISEEGDNHSPYIEPALQPRAIWTMHKLCSTIIKNHYLELGLRKDFKVIPSQKLKDILIKDCAQIVGTKREDGQKTKECREQGHCVKNGSPKCAICIKYGELMKTLNYVDYDDQIALACKLLHKASILKEVQEGATHLLVDEYQDINYSQWKLIQLLSKDNTHNLFVVGDAYQSIYSFRGGDPKYIINFKTDYAPDADVRELLTSWRCPANIYKGAFHVVHKYCGGDIKILDRLEFKNKAATKIKIKTFTHHNLEAAFIAKQIREIGPSYSVLILVPRMKYATPIKRELRKKFIAFFCEYDLEKTDLYFIGALLKWLKDSSSDVDLRLLVEEIINRGASDIPAIQAEYRGKKESLLKREEAFRQISDYWTELQPRKTLYLEIKDLRDQPQFKKLVEILMELKKVSRLKKDTSSFISIIINKLNIWHEIPDFAEEIQTVAEELRGLATPPGENSIRIMTMLKAKGLQADYVFIVGLDNNVLPRLDATDMEKQEDSRIFYVSATRAKKELYILNSKSRDTKITQVKTAGISDFVKAMPVEYVEDLDFPI